MPYLEQWWTQFLQEWSHHHPEQELEEEPGVLAVVGSSLEQHVEPGVGQTFLPTQWEKNKHIKNTKTKLHVNTIYLKSWHIIMADR